MTRKTTSYAVYARPIKSNTEGAGALDGLSVVAGPFQSTTRPGKEDPEKTVTDGGKGKAEKAMKDWLSDNTDHEACVLPVPEFRRVQIRVIHRAVYA